MAKLTYHSTILIDSTVIQRCCAGDRDAQRRVYEGTVDRIYNLLLRLAANPDDAFDLAQDTYLRAFSRLPQFDFKSSFETWLYRIAVNEALGWRRQARSGQRHGERWARMQDDCAADDPTGAADAIHRGLAALEPLDRAVLLLRYRSELDYRAMAEVLGVAEGTVASRLNRARGKLKSALQTCDREGTGSTDHPIGTTDCNGSLGLPDGTNVT